MSNAPPPSSDSIYKRLYAFPRMVEDLLRSLFADQLDADYGTLEKLPAEHVGDALQQRRGDTVWRLRARGASGWLDVLVMLEFQSTADSFMALRVLEYTALLYGEMLRRGVAKPGALPPVLPVVLYNGDAPWSPRPGSARGNPSQEESPRPGSARGNPSQEESRATEMRNLIGPPPAALAPCQPCQRHFVLDERRVRAEDLRLRELTWAVAQLEQSRSAADLARAARRLAARLAGAGQGELRRAFAHWLWALRRRLDSGAPAPRPPEDLDLEDMAVSLEERVAQWPKPYIEQGREEGREEGISLGREEGMAHERQLLRRLTAARFDVATADRLAAALGAEADPERLAEVGEAIVRCATGGELLREVGGGH